MKIRVGFVSNSSSSSFCIYGVFMEEDDVRKHFGFGVNKSVDEDEEGPDANFEESNIWEELDDSEIPHWAPDGSDGGVFIGLELKECADDETMGGFKYRVFKLINSYASVKIDPSEFKVYEYAWSDR